MARSWYPVLICERVCCGEGVLGDFGVVVYMRGIEEVDKGGGGGGNIDGGGGNVLWLGR